MAAVIRQEDAWLEELLQSLDDPTVDCSVIIINSVEVPLPFVPSRRFVVRLCSILERYNCPHRFIVELNLSNLLLGPNQLILPLMTLLQQKHRQPPSMLQKLILNDNSLDGNAVQVLAHTLQVSRIPLVVLDLSNNPEIGDDGAQALANCDTVKKLFMNNCGIENIPVAEGEAFRHVEELRLEDNLIRYDTGSQALIQTLLNGTTVSGADIQLQRLYLSGNNTIAMEPILTILEIFLRHNDRVRNAELVMAITPIPDEPITKLLGELRNYLNLWMYGRLE